MKSRINERTNPIMGKSRYYPREMIHAMDKFPDMTEFKSVLEKYSKDFASGELCGFEKQPPELQLLVLAKMVFSSNGTSYLATKAADTWMREHGLKADNSTDLINRIGDTPFSHNEVVYAEHLARAFIMPAKQVVAFMAAHGLEPDSPPKEYDEITPEHAPWLEEEE